MKSSPSVSSSDLERARAIAERLVGTPGAEPALVEKPAEYVSFKARGVAAAPPSSRQPTPAVAPPSPPSPPMRPPPPEPPPFAAELARVERPAPRPEPPPRPAPVPPPRAAAPPRPTAPPPPPPPLPPPPPPAAPESESVFEMDNGAGLPPPDDGLGLFEDEQPQVAAEASGPEHLGPEHLGPEHLDPEHLDPEHLDPEHLEPRPLEPEAPAFEAAPAEPSLDFSEDIADTAAATVGAVEEAAAEAEPPPTWAQILDDAIYLAHARCALVMDGAGLVHESRGDWPKNTLDKVAARLLRGIEQAPALPNPDATQLVEIQLGSFFLTGVRVVLQESPVVVGFLSQAPVKREARPGLEAEIKRGTPLA